MNRKNILILGAGVSGLTTALKLLQSGHKVTIWSKDPEGQLPHTSLSAYAMWVPVKIDADPRIELWADHSLSEFKKLSCRPNSGVAMRQIVSLKTVHEEPWYAQKYAEFRHADAGEISTQYQDAHILDAAPVIDPTVYLPWLARQVIAAGGRFAQRQVQHFGDCPAEYTVIVNCTALGARQLAGDQDVHPERVQVVTIKANGFDKVVIDDEGPNKRACIVPHHNYIKLGAVFDQDSESLEVDDHSTEDILNRCRAMVPGFRAELSDVLSVTRALRPERKGWLPRVEMERLGDGRVIVHNYGHDGMGFILSHGIASEIQGYLTAL